MYPVHPNFPRSYMKIDCKFYLSAFNHKLIDENYN